MSPDLSIVAAEPFFLGDTGHLERDFAHDCADGRRAAHAALARLVSTGNPTLLLRGLAEAVPGGHIDISGGEMVGFMHVLAEALIVARYRAAPEPAPIDYLDV